MNESIATTKPKTTAGISFCKAYATSDGRTFATLAEAQRTELGICFHADKANPQDGLPADELLDWIIRCRSQIIDILSTTASSRPRARKSHGGTRTRKPKPNTSPSAA